MAEFLSSIDAGVFSFINGTLANPFFDAVMPPLTNWNQSAVGLGLAATILALLNWKGGRKGRIVTFLLVVLILAGDQLSSSIIKPLVARPRPCHEVNGAPAVSGIRLLVDCGSGYSFPSSHAVNNVAFATLFAFYYRRFAPVLFFYAFAIGLSRIVVGVHYPSDVLGGALIGGMLAMTLIAIWNRVGGRFAFLAIGPRSTRETGGAG